MSNYNFSLVLPIFNEQDVVEYALDEIIKLNKEDNNLFEIVIVDDGSND